MSTRDSTQRLLKLTRLAFILAVITGFIVLSFANSARAQHADNPPLPGPEQLSDAFARVAEQVGPVVVSVHSESVPRLLERFLPDNPDAPAPFGPRRRERGNRPPGFRREGLGSGIILSSDGYILTNYHVIRGATKLRVSLADDGRKEFDATVVGTDPKSDMAIIKIEAKDLPAARLGDSEKLRVGEWVLAIGAPFGLAHTVTAGIISAKGRSNVGVADYEDFVQTDASINPGNSGGPLVNMRGEVIGMNTAIASHTGVNEGIGFAIPVNMIKQLLPTLKSGSKIARGYLGVMIQDANEELGEKFGAPNARGAFVAEAQPDGPGAKAGLKNGDIIVKVDGKLIADSNQLRNTIAATPPGTTVTLGILRQGKEQNIQATLAQLPSELAAEDDATESTELGIVVEPLTAEIRHALDLKENHGILVVEVEFGGRANMAGLEAGDVILEVNRAKISSVEEFNRNIATSPKNLLLLAKNKDGARYVVMRMGN